MARALDEWLPNVIQMAKPWMSEEDISKGALWTAEVEKSLSTHQIALICVTSENQQSPWMLFETGLLKQHTKVYPVLLDIDQADLRGPLMILQATALRKDDMYRLIRNLNEELGETRIADSRLRLFFDHSWKDFEARFQEVQAMECADPAHPQPAETELKITRLQNRLEHAERVLRGYERVWPVPPLPDKWRGDPVPMIANWNRENNSKVVIVDDDPGGVFSLPGTDVFLGACDETTIRDVLLRPTGVAFFVTDARSQRADQAERMNTLLGSLIGRVSLEIRRPIILISRQDSTLRGHYPIEAVALRNGFERTSTERFRCELFCPAYAEAGKVTLNGIHWIKNGEFLTPIGLTEFARDPLFEFRESRLDFWLRERLGGESAGEPIAATISIGDIRLGGPEKVASILVQESGIPPKRRVIADGFEPEDMDVLAAGVCLAEQKGVSVFVRAGISYLRARTGVRHEATVSTAPPFAPVREGPGLVLVGSISDVSVRQRARAAEVLDITVIELAANELSYPWSRDAELQRVRNELDAAIASQHDVLICVSGYFREKYEGHDVAIGRVLSGLREIVSPKILERIGFLLAKGGATGFLSLRGILGSTRARFVGTLMPGVGRFEVANPADPPVFVMHGNVGDDDALSEAIRTISGLRPGR